ncbi:MAG: hypothetical protein AB7U83_04190 [Vicinamibacterales bacterium]
MQGDGEVNGTAVEHSLTGRFRFTLHKGRALAGPRAETVTHYYTLASIACDVHVAKAVDLTQVVVGKIPKDVFR